MSVGKTTDGRATRVAVQVDGLTPTVKVMMMMMTTRLDEALEEPSAAF